MKRSSKGKVPPPTLPKPKSSTKGKTGKDENTVPGKDENKVPKNEGNIDVPSQVQKPELMRVPSTEQKVLSMKPRAPTKIKVVLPKKDGDITPDKVSKPGTMQPLLYQAQPAHTSATREDPPQKRLKENKIPPPVLPKPGKPKIRSTLPDSDTSIMLYGKKDSESSDKDLKKIAPPVPPKSFKSQEKECKSNEIMKASDCKSTKDSAGEFVVPKFEVRSGASGKIIQAGVPFLPHSKMTQISEKTTTENPPPLPQSAPPSLTASAKKFLESDISVADDNANTRESEKVPLLSDTDFEMVTADMCEPNSKNSNPEKVSESKLFPPMEEFVPEESQITVGHGNDPFTAHKENPDRKTNNITVKEKDSDVKSVDLGEKSVNVAAEQDTRHEIFKDKPVEKKLSKVAENKQEENLTEASDEKSVDKQVQMKLPEMSQDKTIDNGEQLKFEEADYKHEEEVEEEKPVKQELSGILKEKSEVSKKEPVEQGLFEVTDKQVEEETVNKTEEQQLLGLSDDKTVEKELPIQPDNVPELHEGKQEQIVTPGVCENKSDAQAILAPNQEEIQSGKLNEKVEMIQKFPNVHEEKQPENELSNQQSSLEVSQDNEVTQNVLENVSDEKVEEPNAKEVTKKSPEMPEEVRVGDQEPSKVPEIKHIEEKSAELPEEDSIEHQELSKVPEMKQIEEKSVEHQELAKVPEIKQTEEKSTELPVYESSAQQNMTEVSQDEQIEQRSQDIPVEKQNSPEVTVSESIQQPKEPELLQDEQIKKDLVISVNDPLEQLDKSEVCQDDQKLSEISVVEANEQNLTNETAEDSENLTKEKPIEEKLLNTTIGEPAELQSQPILTKDGKDEPEQTVDEPVKQEIQPELVHDEHTTVNESVQMLVTESPELQSECIKSEDQQVKQLSSKISVDEGMGHIESTEVSENSVNASELPVDESITEKPVGDKQAEQKLKEISCVESVKNQDQPKLETEQVQSSEQIGQHPEVVEKDSIDEVSKRICEQASAEAFEVIAGIKHSNQSVSSEVSQQITEKSQNQGLEEKEISNNEIPVVSIEPPTPEIPVTPETSDFPEEKLAAKRDSLGVIEVVLPEKNVEAVESNKNVENVESKDEEKLQQKEIDSEVVSAAQLPNENEELNRDNSPELFPEMTDIDIEDEALQEQENSLTKEVSEQESNMPPLSADGVADKQVIQESDVVQQTALDSPKIQADTTEVRSEERIPPEVMDSDVTGEAKQSETVHEANKQETTVDNKVPTEPEPVLSQVTKQSDDLTKLTDSAIAISDSNKIKDRNEVSKEFKSDPGKLDPLFEKTVQSEVGSENKENVESIEKITDLKSTTKESLESALVDEKNKINEEKKEAVKVGGNSVTGTYLFMFKHGMIMTLN